MVTNSLSFSTGDLRAITARAVLAAQAQTDVSAMAIVKRALQQIKLEVAAGRTHALAMSLKLGSDIEIQSGKAAGKSVRQIDSSALSGIAARVWQSLFVFTPTLEYWSREEGDQRDSYTVEGFNIVLHWSDSTDLLSRVEKLNDRCLGAELARIISETQTAICDKAANILSQLEGRASLQAKAGKTWAIVMSLTSGTDYMPPQGRAKSISPNALGPGAKAVWDSCADFTPTLEYWSREEGQFDSYIVDGFNIVIH